MRLTIAAVGRLSLARAGPEAALFDHYARRLAQPPTVREVAEERSRETGERRRREASRLLEQVPRGAVLVALDAGGVALDSPGLARRIGAWRDSGRQDLCFAFGGPDGLDETVRQQADFILSMGPMTWPHLLARGMLVEQLYRAQCILAGHPYHRD
jgi:23S rRNA (pseudouridine1915-N3)-methyltransferase